MERKEHWEHVFATKQEQEVSWYQKSPETSLKLISKRSIPKEGRIIEVGGGDSYLVDALLEHGYSNITLLDISEKAIERLKQRLGSRATEVSFIVSDILDFTPTEAYDFWHDRASFHFQTDPKDIERYASVAAQSIVKGGYMVIGAFSENGPQKCSGLPITQYSSEKMRVVFHDHFELLESFTEMHQTPFQTSQDFIFCTFQKK